MQYGIVKDILDPLKLGRVKVNIYHIHDNISTDDLGWSNVSMPATVPAVSGIGQSVNLIAEVLWKDGELLDEQITGAAGQVIRHVSNSTTPAAGDIKVNGTLVFGFFEDPMMQEFVVVGTLPTKTAGLHDNNVRVRGEADPNASDPKGVYEPASGYAPIYPYNNVMEKESGHVKEYDDTPGAERIMERHKSGTQYEIQPNGSKIEKIVRDNYTLIVGNDTVEIKGNVKVYISGDANIAVAKDLTAQVGGNMNTIVDGNADLLVKGDIDGEVRGNIDMQVGKNNLLAHITYNEDGTIATHNTKNLGGLTKNEAIATWFPIIKNIDGVTRWTMDHRGMRQIKEMPATAAWVNIGNNYSQTRDYLSLSESNGVQKELFYSIALASDPEGDLGTASVSVQELGDDIIDGTNIYFLMDVSTTILGQIDYAFKNNNFHAIEQLGALYAVDINGVQRDVGGVAMPVNNLIEFDIDKLKLVGDLWTYPGYTSLTASFGNVDLHLEGTLTGLVDGDVNMTVLNNAKLDVRKNADIDIGGNITADVVGSMTASVQGATSLRGVDEDNVTLLSIDFDNAASKITLDSTDVEIKGKLKVFGTTTTGTGNLILDTHQHAGDGGDNSGPNTGGPANP
jgi:hypothetical protein